MAHEKNSNAAPEEELPSSPAGARSQSTPAGHGGGRNLALRFATGLPAVAGVVSLLVLGPPVAFALLILVGNTSMVLAVQFGYLTL